jgi:uncharacterized protein
MENKYGHIYGGAVFVLFLAFIFLFLVNFFNISYPITVTTLSATDLSVVGEGQVDVVPDTANVSIGIQSDGKTVDEIQKSINTTNNNIVAALSKIGIDKKDIATSNYSINPSYDYANGQTPTGYNGSATLTIKVKDTSKLPSVISASTEAGANQIYGTNYSIENPDKYREEARNEAIANAKAQAQKLANQLGIRLGKVTNIAESTSGGGGPQPMMYKEMARDSMSVAPAPDLQPGSQTITSIVTLSFEKR